MDDQAYNAHTHTHTEMQHKPFDYFYKPFDNSLKIVQFC